MDNKNSYSYFCNRECEYFPCHKGGDPEQFNCLFCYCPLYMLGNDCGGNFGYTEKGVKDCSACLIPHSKGGYDYITGHLREIIKQMPENRPKKLGGT
jgi:Zn-finger protein